MWVVWCLGTLVGLGLLLSIIESPQARRRLRGKVGPNKTVGMGLLSGETIASERVFARTGKACVYDLVGVDQQTSADRETKFRGKVK
jgi:hypothetical protein